jgi:hypothetical protein
MSFTPKQIREMSLWEFHHTVEGYKLANGSGEGELEPPSEDEFEAALGRLAD